jgi:hypothetical protein
MEIAKHGRNPLLIILELWLLRGPDPEGSEESPCIRASLSFEGLWRLVDAADNGARRAGCGNGARHVRHRSRKESQLIVSGLLGRNEGRHELVQVLLWRRRWGWQCRSCGYRRWTVDDHFGTVARHDAFWEDDASAFVQLYVVGCHDARHVAILVGLYGVVEGGCSVVGHDVVAIEEAEDLCVVMDVVTAASIVEVGKVNVPVVFAGDSGGDIGGKRECAVRA